MKTFFGKPQVLAAICSLFWVAVGTRMLLMGAQSALKLTSVTQIAIVAIFVMIILFLKGWLLFGKMARENLNRLKTLAQPIPFYKLFPGKTYLFILVFAPSGITMGKFIENPFYRSMILLSVGSALFLGGVLYLVFWKRAFGEEET